jgi:hypothetical protein
MILDPEIACRLVDMLRRLNAKEIAGPDALASNAVDDDMDAVLVEGRDRGADAEIDGIIEGLNEETRGELAGLFLWGREPDDFDTFKEAVAAARERIVPRLSSVLRGDPQAAEHVTDALERLGVSCRAVAERPAGAPRPEAPERL